MADLSTNDVHGRTITAFFDTRGAAQKATDDLVAIGIPHQQIRLTEGAGTTATTGQPSATQDKGFWEELKDLFMPDEDRYGYAEGLRRGGFLLSVQADEAMYSRVLDVLDTDGAVDMDEREASWRASGWSGYQAGSAGVGAAALGVGGAAFSSPSTSTANAGSAGVRSAPANTVATGRDEVIPVYEETAKVAKRDVNHGRVRIRSYVVETPISEQVNLRNEQVQVERRPVDRPIAAGDAVFQDRVIEAEEHAEEAVITKEARVKEEISLRKTVENQSQTLTDSVRRTEVEVEDERSGRAVGTARAFSAATDANRIAEHMDVIASDGTKIGTVDHLDGDRIKLARTTSPDGEHHYVPLSWIDHRRYPCASEQVGIGSKGRLVNDPAGDGKTIPANSGAVDLTVPVLEEQAYLSKETVTTGRVRVVTHSETIERLAEATLHSEAVEVTRVPIDQPVTGALPQVRTEGEVTIVPILEEVLVVEKRLVLKEELHIRRRPTVEQVEVPVTLRRQTARVERSDET